MDLMDDVNEQHVPDGAGRGIAVAPGVDCFVPGERAIAQLKQWDILRRLRCCPQRAGEITRAVLVLQLREAR